MTPPREPAREPRVRWGWLVFAVVLGVVVLFVTGFGGAACATGGDAISCAYEPFIGVAGVWVAWIAYVLLAAYAVWQAFRRR